MPIPMPPRPAPLTRALFPSRGRAFAHGERNRNACTSSVISSNPGGWQVHKLLGELEAILPPLMSKNTNAFALDAPPDLGGMQTDKTKLRQCLLNLLSNAAGAFFKQVFRDGFFHADLHPGNIFVDRDGALAVVDFGIMGRLHRSWEKRSPVWNGSRAVDGPPRWAQRSPRGA